MARWGEINGWMRRKGIWNLMMIRYAPRRGAAIRWRPVASLMANGMLTMMNALPKPSF